VRPTRDGRRRKKLPFFLQAKNLRACHHRRFDAVHHHLL